MSRTWIRADQHEELPGSLTALEIAWHPGSNSA